MTVELPALDYGSVGGTHRDNNASGLQAGQFRLNRSWDRDATRNAPFLLPISALASDRSLASCTTWSGIRRTVPILSWLKVKVMTK